MPTYSPMNLPGPSRTVAPIPLGSTQGAGGIVPTGTIDITANGTYDVTQYASADVNVSGGPSLGSPVPVFQEWTAVPAVGNDTDFSSFALTMKLGSSTLAANEPETDPLNFQTVAAGVSVFSAWIPVSGELPAAAGYIVTVDDQFKYGTVEQWSGTVAIETDTIEGTDCYRYGVTVPDIPDGGIFIIYVSF